jgi:membrane associated rhomboid family serine protease
MGIYDREYYRREGPSFLASFTDRGKVCKWLILINVIIFVIPYFLPKPTTTMTVPGPDGPVEVVTGTGPDAFTEALWLKPSEVLHGQVWRLLTYSFLHGGIWHILVNMLFLWFFGADMEDLYGRKEFLAFYLTAAVLGGLVFFAQGAVRGSDIPCVGASGAVFAVMVLFALHYPTRTMYVWFVPLPVWLFVLFQVGLNVWWFAAEEQTSVAVSVHLAGAAFGFGYYKLNWRLLELWPDFSGWRTRRRARHLRVYREEPADDVLPFEKPARRADVDEHLEAKVDAVLDKVAKYGQDSLTDSERQILVQASEHYRRRRT